MKPFFLVWKQDGQAPTVTHPSIESAKAEAARLALKHPGNRFFVLEAIGAQFHQVPVTWEVVDRPVNTLNHLMQNEWTPPTLTRTGGTVAYHQ